ncbi:potassium transporter Kup [Orrella marina]|uniref:Probable potassium transport system protein Kup n=1 Tax=Orrella marina TaxID=2163011 RepID=A0A2R4XK46_9BURK|nr:KUP/HAK/KT family potassium transporter [Orrella marina]AWB34212.1 potassium transporter Kup [Orrella marina]
MNVKSSDSSEVATSGKLLALVIGALGVVFGDIGTSPLYAFEVVFANPTHPVAPTPENVLGVLSLFVWALILVVTIKYVIFIMRFDNEGEGGIVALMTLLVNKAVRGGRLRRWFVPLGLVGAALFYGDGVITPAISVVSAVEGLETISPALSLYVVPVSLVILVALFLVQKQGTERLSRAFGPIMLLWFLVLALLGIYSIAQDARVLAAINPLHALIFIQTDAVLSFFLLGAVVLCMTGAEALYADMGHFGAKPIQRAWILIAFPALVLNYLGQGALVLQSPENIHNPFFRMAPDWALHGLILLATVATVVASQAVISGVFSMTQQLIQLRAIPRMTVLHTSLSNAGQIYIPATNWIMLALVVMLVLYFQSSNAMGGAYGIAVTGTMVITDLFAIAVVIRVRKWHWSRAILGALPFLMIDSLFFSANAFKILDGGWFPVSLSVVIMMVMMIWSRGVERIVAHESANSLLLKDFVGGIEDMNLFRGKGTAVFLTSDEHYTPPAMILLAQRMHALPQKVICLTVHVEEVPFVAASRRFELTPVDHGLYSLILRYGYRDSIEIPAVLSQLFPADDPEERYGYLINRWSLVAQKGDGWSVWRKNLFIFMFRNVPAQWRLFQMPPARVVEIGERLII